MSFIQQPLERTELGEEIVDGKRFYTLPSGERFHSVTTVISEALGTAASIKKWRDRVGADEAERISGSARTRGTAVHLCCARHLLGETVIPNGVMPINFMTFKQFRGLLDKHVTAVLGVEIPLHSRLMRTAGRADAIVEWDGAPAIVDFKTARKTKTERDIPHYFLQSAAYARMSNEMYGTGISTLVVAVVADGEMFPQVFVRRREEWDDKVTRIFDARPLAI